MGLWEYRATPLRVIDGDTLELLIDNGFSSRQQETIRLLNVYAPESKELGGPETKAYIEQWLATYIDTTLRWPLHLYTYPSSSFEPNERRTFTRYLAEVWDHRLTRSLNESIAGYVAAHPQWGTGDT